MGLISTKPQYKSQVVPASSTAVPCIPNQSIIIEGSRVRLEVLVGKVVGTPGIKFQHSSLPYNWSDLKTATLSASTDQTVTFTEATQTVNAVAHGYLPQQIVALATSGALPRVLEPGVAYQVCNVTANSFQLQPLVDVSLATFAFVGAGSGTHTVCAVRPVEITLNPEVAGDQGFLPLKPSIRAVATTSGAQSIQVVGFQSSSAP